MKKLLAILLSAVLALGCVSALAEAVVVRFVEDSPDFDITMPLPEGASVATKEGTAEGSKFEIVMDGVAPVHAAVAPSDIYEKLSMNDLSDEEIESLMQLAGEQYEAPEMTVDVTPSGNKYIHICANSEYDIDSIFTLYMGYFVELTQWYPDYAKLADADYAFMQQLLYNLSFDAAK